MPAVHEHMTGDEYRSRPGYSKSNVSDFTVSGLYMQHRMHNPVEKDVFLLGSATHCSILEPEEFGNRYTVLPPTIKTKTSKAAQAFAAQHEGLKILTPDQLEHVKWMTKSVMEHPVARDLVTGGKSEMSIEFPMHFLLSHMQGSEVPFFKWTRDRWEIDNLDETSFHILPMKCRPDHLLVQDGIVTDLKTARDITPDGFGKASFNYHYHWSALITLIGLEAVYDKKFQYMFCCVESSPPYDCAVYEVMDDVLEVAETELERWLPDLAKADYLGRWDGQKQQVMPLEFPPWAFTKARQMLMDMGAVF